MINLSMKIHPPDAQAPKPCGNVGAIQGVALRRDSSFTGKLPAITDSF
ncbi:hypothetical protein ACN6MY_07375 [Peribacillus sp. B-H-3]|jgi:hypothetical protein